MAVVIARKATATMKRNTTRQQLFETTTYDDTEITFRNVSFNEIRLTPRRSDEHNAWRMTPRLTCRVESPTHGTPTYDSSTNRTANPGVVGRQKSSGSLLTQLS